MLLCPNGCYSKPTFLFCECVEFVVIDVCSSSILSACKTEHWYQTSIRFAHGKWCKLTFQQTHTCAVIHWHLASYYSCWELNSISTFAQLPSTAIADERCILLSSLVNIRHLLLEWAWFAVRNIRWYLKHTKLKINTSQNHEAAQHNPHKACSKRTAKLWIHTFNGQKQREPALGDVQRAGTFSWTSLCCYQQTGAAFFRGDIILQT